MVASTNVGGRGYVDAGYTYLGQMISHDIVPPTNRSDSLREVSGNMDLDSIYGKLEGSSVTGSTDSAGLFDDDGRFRLGRFNRHDLPRNRDGFAMIPEPRNDENIIIAQLHSFWQRFHNYLIENYYAADAMEARKMVTLVFQLVVIEDFLREILDDDIFNLCVLNEQDFLGLDKVESRKIFNKAAFRFGHSMVRENYRLRKFMGEEHVFFDLDELFQVRKPDRHIEKHKTINWRLFFRLPDDTEEQKASPINTSIARFMSSVPTEQDPGVHIALKNLVAGLEAGLLPGKHYADRLAQTGKTGIAVLDRESMDAASFNNVKNLSVDELPLWTYILLEAQLQGERRCLGTLGGLLNGQVLRDAIRDAGHSVFQNNVYSFEDVIHRLGTLGKLLMEISREFKYRKTGGKRLGMTHLIILLEEHGY